MAAETIHNPKNDNQIRDGWYDYYAGFSEAFVEDVLGRLPLSENAIIMDPWNGTGTTTQVAQDKGLAALGYDINPVMVIVARARSVEPGVSEKLGELRREIIEEALGNHNDGFSDRDPLGRWLAPESTGTFRSLERAVQTLLVGQQQVTVHGLANLGACDGLAAVFYTALFKVARDILVRFRSSNPTWIKEPATPDERLQVCATEIVSAFEHHVAFIGKTLEGRAARPLSTRGSARVEVASSTSLPLKPATVDAVISSPPYCTRIDYVVATKPELALLGFSETAIAELRDHMIGTPTITRQDLRIVKEWGPACRTFLEAVREHPSKASSTYYLRNYLQYFDSMYQSIIEIDRVLHHSGHCVLVVQDSYYKDIHNDLPLVFAEMARSVEWALLERHDYRVGRTMAGLNGRSKKYRTASGATESILIFQKQ